MLIPKKTKIEVYAYLFKEGCLVAQKDYYKPKHEEIDCPNIHVCQLLRSLVSRKLVTETFNWQWYYWYLNDEGVEYLRNYLHLPEDATPNTHKSKAGVAPARLGPTPGDKPEGEYGGGKGGGGRGGGFGGEYRSEGGKGVGGKGGKGFGRGGGV